MWDSVPARRYRDYSVLQEVRPSRESPSQSWLGKGPGGAMIWNSTHAHSGKDPCAGSGMKLMASRGREPKGGAGQLVLVSPRVRRGSRVTNV